MFIDWAEQRAATGSVLDEIRRRELVADVMAARRERKKTDDSVQIPTLATKVTKPVKKKSVNWESKLDGIPVPDNPLVREPDAIPPILMNEIKQTIQRDGPANPMDYKEDFLSNEYQVSDEEEEVMDKIVVRTSQAPTHNKTTARGSARQSPAPPRPLQRNAPSRGRGTRSNTPTPLMTISRRQRAQRPTRALNIQRFPRRPTQTSRWWTRSSS